MKIKLSNGSPALEAEILALEAGLHCRLCDSFRAFVKVYDGAKPESNSFELGGGSGSAVHEFIPVYEILRRRTHIENIPSTAYPVARDDCGNFVIVDEGRGGAVFFWDHELAEFTALAGSFGEFLDILEPFDINSVKLKAGQVKRVWVDPEFLKSLKK